MKHIGAAVRRNLVLALLATTSPGEQVHNSSEAFSARLSEPRISLVAKEGRTPDQQKMLASRPDFNIYKTLAHNPELYERWSGLGQYLLNGSTLPARDREIVILRMGWLCQAPYEWSQHARIAKSAALLSDAEIHRIAQGAQAAGWSDFDRTLIAAVDELRYEGQLRDASWNALRSRYSLEQSIDAIFTAGQYQLVSMALNSAGVQLDPGLQDRIPVDVKAPALAGPPKVPRPAAARVQPMSLPQMSPEQRTLVMAQVRDGKLPNLYATLIIHTKFYEPRWRFGSYLQRDSHLPARTRELLILRTAWLTKTEYEWVHHVPIARQAGLSDADIARISAGPQAGWNNEERALLEAADQLRREAFISDATWIELNRHYDTAQVLEIVFTVGGYAMTAMAINSLGIQIEDGYPRMPAQ
jgi:4-carboxymuconolactone decarboxylase